MRGNIRKNRHRNLRTPPSRFVVLAENHPSAYFNIVDIVALTRQEVTLFGYFLRCLPASSAAPCGYGGIYLPPVSPAVVHTSRLPPASVRQRRRGRSRQRRLMWNVRHVSPSHPPAHILTIRATCVATVIQGNRHALTRDLIVGCHGDGRRPWPNASIPAFAY